MRQMTRQRARRGPQAVRSGRTWNGAERMRLVRMAEHQMSAEEIARRLGRSEDAVRSEARKQHVTLPPAAAHLF